MNLEMSTSVAVVVPKQWANLYGVRAFLRDGKEIKGEDASHMIFAKVMDSNDPHGLWISNVGQKDDDSTVKVKAFMIPWDQILTVVVMEKLSPDLWAESKRLGFVSEVNT